MKSKELEDLVRDYVDTPEDLQHFRGDSYAPYHHQINTLYEQYETELWDMLETFSDEVGEPVLVLLNGMHKRYTHHDITCLQDVKQWVVWFGLERVAHRLADELEADHE